MFKSEHHINRAASLRGMLVAGGLTALLSGVAGCGGTTYNGNTLGGIQSATPAAYGLEAFNAVNAADNTGFLEVSGLASADGQTAYATAAVDSTATPLSGLSVGGKIPLGFTPGGQFADSKLYGGVAAGAPVVFRVALSNGQNSTTTIPINPSSVVLTSPEAAGFTQSFTFNSALTTGPLSNALYTTPTFNLPFATTGLHSLTVAVADTSGQSSTTTYAVPVIAPANAGVLAQVVDAKGNPIPGATATITGAVAGAAQPISDAQGVVILFAAPGTQTITVNGKATNVTLTAGQLLDTTADNSPLTVPGA
jgi:hypothetical protein